MHTDYDEEADVPTHNLSTTDNKENEGKQIETAKPSPSDIA